PAVDTRSARPREPAAPGPWALPLAVSERRDFSARARILDEGFDAPLPRFLAFGTHDPVHRRPPIGRCLRGEPVPGVLLSSEPAVEVAAELHLAPLVRVARFGRV